MIALALALAAPVLPIREIDHPTYLDAADQPVGWPVLRDAARQTDVMRRVRARRAGRTALRVLFTSATAAEAYATVRLVEQRSDWAWALGAQTTFTGVAAGLLWADLPRDRRVARAEMLAAANAWLRTRPADAAPR